MIWWKKAQKQAFVKARFSRARLSGSETLLLITDEACMGTMTAIVLYGPLYGRMYLALFFGGKVQKATLISYLDK